MHLGGAGFAVFSPHVYRTRVTEVCLSLDTPFGWRSVEHSLRNPRGVFWVAQKCAQFFQGSGSDPVVMMPLMPASVGQPSLHAYYACMVFLAKGVFWRNCRQILRKTFFFLVFGFFCVVDTLLCGGVVRFFGISGLGRARFILVLVLFVSLLRS